MSSSRSIAAARQRRAAEAPQPPQNRPRTSIASQSAFSPQPQPQPQFQQGQIRVGQRPGQPVQQQQQFQQQQFQQQQFQQQQFQQQQFQQQQFQQQQFQRQAQPQQVPLQQQEIQPKQYEIGKISVPDAIGLITLRLGRLELLTKKLDGNPIENQSTNEAGIVAFDDVVIKSIISRLEDLEKMNSITVKQTDAKTNGLVEGMTLIEDELKKSKDTIEQLQNMVLDLSQQIADFSNSITLPNTVLDDYSSNEQLSASIEIHDTEVENFSVNAESSLHELKIEPSLLVESNVETELTSNQVQEQIVNDKNNVSIVVEDVDSEPEAEVNATI
jgi:hypothetical protein